MKSSQIFLITTITILLSACGGSGDGDDYVNPSSLSMNVLTTPSAGRLLASQCAQCHGTDGISVSGIESLAGESDEILGEMSGMKRSTRNKVMHLQAKGYSDTQIREIATYFSSLYQRSGNSSNDEERDDDRRENDRDGDDD